MKETLHLLKHYGIAETETLCGLPVPAFFSEKRNDVRYVSAPGHTCVQCDAIFQSKTVVAFTSPSVV